MAGCTSPCSASRHCYSAWFSPDSGIIDDTEVTSTSSVDFSSADGLFLNGGTLYYGTTDGNLHSVAFTPGTVAGTPGSVSGSPTTVSGPATGDGLNWANRAMFLGAGCSGGDSADGGLHLVVHRRADLHLQRARLLGHRWRHRGQLRLELRRRQHRHRGQPEPHLRERRAATR